MNYLSFDVEEWFQVDTFTNIIQQDDWAGFDSRIGPNVHKLLEILDLKKVTATFFVLGWVAERHPDLVSLIARQGHEIACHGYGHQNITLMEKDAFTRDITRAKDILELIINKPVVGYRAPNFYVTKQSFWIFDVLKECGFRYDSSLYPRAFQHQKNLPCTITNRAFTMDNGLIEMPVATWTLWGLNLPVGGGGFFRFLPYKYFSVLLNKISRSGENGFVFYLHPWELDTDQPKIRATILSRWRHHLNRGSTELKLMRLLDEFDFQPLASSLKQQSCHEK